MYTLQQGYTQDKMCFTEEEMEVLARVEHFSQVEHLLVIAKEWLLWVNLSYSYKKMKTILIITIGWKYVYFFIMSFVFKDINNSRIPFIKYGKGKFIL